jgi:hypothetical protein
MADDDSSRPSASGEALTHGYHNEISARIRREQGHRWAIFRLLNVRFAPLSEASQRYAPATICSRPGAAALQSNRAPHLRPDRLCAAGSEPMGRLP